MSRRFGLELESRLLRARALTQDVSESEIKPALDRMEAIGFRMGHRNMLSAWGYLHPADTALIQDIVFQMRDLRASAESMGQSEAELLLLNALATNDVEAATAVSTEYAKKPRADAAWIRVEVLLEALGLDVPTPDSQWLEPYETVRDRWLGLYTGLIERTPTV